MALCSRRRHATRHGRKRQLAASLLKWQECQKSGMVPPLVFAPLPRPTGPAVQRERMGDGRALGFVAPTGRLRHVSPRDEGRCAARAGASRCKSTLVLVVDLGSCRRPVGRSCSWRAGASPDRAALGEQYRISMDLPEDVTLSYIQRGTDRGTEVGEGPTDERGGRGGCCIVFARLEGGDRIRT